MRGAIAPENSVSVVELNVALSLEKNDLESDGRRGVRTAKKAAHIAPLHYELPVWSGSHNGPENILRAALHREEVLPKRSNERDRRGNGKGWKNLRWKWAGMIVAKGIREAHRPIAANENLREAATGVWNRER